jgi:hypothetical protein
MLEAKLGVTGAEQKSVDLLPAMPILTFDVEFGPPLQSARRAARRLACSTSVLETGRPRELFLTSYKDPNRFSPDDPTNPNRRSTDYDKIKT